MTYKPLLLLILLSTLLGCGEKAPLGATAADSQAQPADIREVMGIAIIEPSERLVSLAAEQSGYIREVKVRPGDVVRKNQVLLVLAGEVEAAQVAQANAKITTQQDAVAAAREQLKLLEIQRAKAGIDLDRDEALFRGNAITQQQLDNTRAALSELDQQIKAQQAVVRQQQSRLGELGADVRYYGVMADNRIVRAPADGMVLSLDARVGQYLDNRTGFGEFAPEGPTIALTEIDEMFADRIKTGQKAIIRPQGSKQVLTTGTVVLTSPYLRKKSLFADKVGDLEDRRVREVRVQIDDPSKVLLGARVECVITVE